MSTAVRASIPTRAHSHRICAATNRNILQRPQPVGRVSIDKPDGGKRLLGIPNLIDRLIQQAIVQILTPVFDPNVSTSSYGFRPKRSAHGAAKQVQRTIRRGYRFAVDMDLSKFFDRV
ncbi:MAG: hypothetical protein KF752_10045 [Pirellulaceae bacterium]|nr:hypothetical protein [Pirellulaceae bacterium]